MTLTLFSFSFTLAVKDGAELLKSFFAIFLTIIPSSLFEKSDQVKLVIWYSDKRERKDEYNRINGIKKLEQKIKFGRLTKTSINNHSYNKFLDLVGEVKVELNTKKIRKDENGTVSKVILVTPS